MEERHRSQAPGRDEPGKHDLLDQALHGPQGGRGQGRGDDDPVQGRSRPERGCPRLLYFFEVVLGSFPEVPKTLRFDLIGRFDTR